MKHVSATILAFVALLLAPPAIPQDEPEFAPPSAEEAPIALLVDMGTGQVLFARNEDRRFMPASITKVMTAFVAFELMEEKRLFPSQVMRMSEATHEEWWNTGSTMFLRAGQAVTVDELLLGITTVSANDGSVVLAEGSAGSLDAWLALMNRKADELGMRDSRFGSPNGFPDGAHTFTSAKDLVTLARAMIARHPSKYARYFGHAGLETNGPGDQTIRQANHDPMVGRVEGADGLKTGYTNEAGYGYLGSAERDGRRLLMVVAASPRAYLRNDAAREFIAWGFNSFHGDKLFAADAPVASLAVQDGTSERVAVGPDGATSVTVPNNVTGTPKLTAHYLGPLRAPIAKGERVGELEIAYPGQPAFRLPLVAREAVSEAGLFSRVANGVRGWFS